MPTGPAISSRFTCMRRSHPGSQTGGSTSSAYREIIRWPDTGDVTTRRLIEDILAEEEEHADDMIKLLGQ